MSAGLLRDALTLLLGFATGVLSGVFGIGGAVVSTPGIRLLGASAKLAIGSTLPSVLPSSIAGTLRYHREGMVEWRAVAWVTPLGVAAAVAQPSPAARHHHRHRCLLFCLFVAVM